MQHSSTLAALLSFACLTSLVTAQDPVTCTSITPITGGIGGGYTLSFSCTCLLQSSDLDITIVFCGTTYFNVPHTYTGGTHTTSVSWTIPSFDTPQTCSLNVSASFIYPHWQYYYPNVATLGYPNPVSSYPNSFDAFAGGVITLTGTQFGLNEAYWCWYEIQNNGIGYETDFISFSDTQIVLPVFGGQGTSLTIYPRWDPNTGCNDYSYFFNAVTYTNPPSFTGVIYPSTGALGNSGGNVILGGTNFPTSCTGSATWTSAKLHNAGGYYADVTLGFTACTANGVNLNYASHASTINDAAHRFDVVLMWGHGAAISLNQVVHFN